MFRGKVYFSGDDGGGPALWASDGTAAGTEKIASFDVPGLFSLGPFRFAVLGDRLVFFADTPASGIEPWATDGTAVGTVQLAEVGAGPISLINVSKVHVAGSLGYFATRIENGEANLWRTDGTPGGTFPLTHFPGTEPFGRFSELSIGTVGSKVTFAANDGVHGFEPWSTNGTLAGTRLVKDVCPGSCSGVKGAFVAQAARLYFVGTANRAGGNVEPWVSNLTAAGTNRLRDLCPGVCSSRPVGFIAAGPFVYFTAIDAPDHRELWRTNGRTLGTVRLTHVVAPGAFFGMGFEALAFGNTLLFAAYEPVHGEELWTSNGLRGGTHLVVDLRGDP
jgi:ELWxxDGT repeat protein